MSLDRRELLLAGAGTLAGALTAQDSQPQSRGKPKRTLRKAFMLDGGLDGKDLAERFQVLRDAGFEGVEPNSPSGTTVEETIAAAQKAGLVVHGLVDSAHWSLPLSHPSAEIRARGIVALETALREGKRLGASSILLVPGIVDPKQPYDVVYQRTQEEIRKVLPLAAECRVKIGIENVWNSFLLSPLEAARYVDEFQSEWVAWHLDIGNVILYGWPEQWARILGKRICKLHIKDFSKKKCFSEGNRLKGFDVELGEGDCGWPAVMQALDEIGYSTATPGNWATAEVRGGDAARMKKISAQMDAIFAM